jgi:hypothetical protein
VTVSAEPPAPAENKPGPSITEISLKPNEQGQLTMRNQLLIRSKLYLADLKLKIMELERECQQVAQSIGSNLAQMDNDICLAAAKYGVDASDVKDGKWSFNIETMKFTRRAA